jgi:phosphoribosyl 1,2-cyclic phosphodiesterase
VRFALLGSGSEGNGLLVEAGATRILLDCGFGLAETVARLGRLGLEPGQLSAIVVTHGAMTCRSG